MPDVLLPGCASRPLVNYLKALGVLRIVAGQGDADAQIRWRDRTLELRSSLDQSGLRDFLLTEYQPTPVVSPWNGGSGFYPKDNKDGLEAIAGSDDPRFGAYRDAIEVARRVVDELDLADKPAGEVKPRLVRRLRGVAPDPALDWIDAAVVVRGDDFTGPPLLGTGGNDGRYDFSNNFARSVVEALLPTASDASKANLGAALWRTPPQLVGKLSLGHFLRDSSPTNSPHGEADSLGNPWELILAIEGSVVFAAAAARRHDTNLRPQAVAPLTVGTTAGGYGSAVGEESVRAELWLPLWEDWTRLSELDALIREFRASVSTPQGSRNAADGLDLARAASERGVPAGISELERVALAERAGQSTLAVPVGRVSVKPRAGSTALRSIDPWLRSTLIFGAGDHCPAGPRAVIDQLKRSAFKLSSSPDDPSAACEVLEAMGRVEETLAKSGTAIAAANVAPLARVAAEDWIAIADDGTHEFAVALAIGSLHDRPRPDSDLPYLRDYLHGTTTNSQGTAFDPSRRLAVKGSSPVEILAAIHARRHLDASRTSSRRGEPGFAAGTKVPLDSIRLFVQEGSLDDDRILALVKGLALLRHGHRGRSTRPAGADALPSPTFEVLALAWHPGWHKGETGPGVTLGARPGWAARLASRSLRPVVADAHLRLRMVGRPPTCSVEDLLLDRGPRTGGNHFAVRLGAALLPSMRTSDLRDLAPQLLQDSQAKEKEDEQ